ncbi:DUF6428 family protein [Marivita hallyeonensis]|uniref:Uncharacterized protein n=1 Tax=Marivita hallyeonensis TaxID=996342 RepID=A0A1M5NB70_9RHOB|nr:DUF6428 family protein [Marivita hallyeonensis]SHG86741.1 hypothetical protein SAMN05443551_0844 [Marivita hallyeonensis]
MTFEHFRKQLDRLPAGAPVVFSTPDGPIRGGYHLTEVRQARLTGLACNGVSEEWGEVALHLLDGFGGPHMPVATLFGILGKAAETLSDAIDYEVSVAFGHGNATRSVYTVTDPVLEGDTVKIALTPSPVDCKALSTAQMDQVRAASACCGG